MVYHQAYCHLPCRSYHKTVEGTKVCERQRSQLSSGFSESCHHQHSEHFIAHQLSLDQCRDPSLTT